MSKKKFLNVIITGSTGGTGLEIVKIFAEAGHNVLLNGPEYDGEDIAREISRKYKVKAAFSNADLSRPDQIREMALLGRETLGPVDVLINNNNVQYVAPFEEFPDEKWEMVLAANLSGAFHASRAVWKDMKKNKFGRIINIASTNALVASEYKVAYVAASHGIAGMTKVLSLEGAPYGITCNTICPGQVRTREMEDKIADQVLAHNISEDQVIQNILLKKQPIKAFVEGNSVGMAALFLTSEYANAITGTVLPIDGGWTIR